MCCLLQSNQQLPKWEMRQHCSTPTPAQALGLTPLHYPSCPADALDASMAMPACAKGAGAVLPAMRLASASHCSVSNKKGVMMISAAQASRVCNKHLLKAYGQGACTHRTDLLSSARVRRPQSFRLPHQQRQLHSAACRRPAAHAQCGDAFHDVFTVTAQTSWRCLQSCSASLLR